MPRDDMPKQGAADPVEELQRRRTVHSPLRYPGGKRRLVPYVAAALEANGLKPDLFVEPFAGGASVALELAASGAVEKIGIADVDPYIAAFWKTAFFDCDWLCKQVVEIEVTLKTWSRLKNGALHHRAVDGARVSVPEPNEL